MPSAPLNLLQLLDFSPAAPKSQRFGLDFAR
jgi:hypothetical protein